MTLSRVFMRVKAVGGNDITTPVVLVIGIISYLRMRRFWITRQGFRAGPTITTALAFTANDCLDIGSGLCSPVSLDYFRSGTTRLQSQRLTRKVGGRQQMRPVRVPSLPPVFCLSGPDIRQLRCEGFGKVEPVSGI
jgi:hypothetical protein